MAMEVSVLQWRSVILRYQKTTGLSAVETKNCSSFEGRLAAEGTIWLGHCRKLFLGRQELMHIVFVVTLNIRRCSDPEITKAKIYA